jgi:hypothetical protein
MWNKRERAIISRLKTPERVQDFLDSIPYRCEDGHLSARAVLRDRRAHCFDGSLFAAACLLGSQYEPYLIDLCATDDDDHMVCAFRWRGSWGAVAKSNFPGLRFREPIFRSPRELVLSYFEFYFSMKRQKSLRSYSKPFRLPAVSRLDWQCDDDAGDKLVELITATPHHDIITKESARTLRRVDRRLYSSQLVGVDLKGVY